MYPLNRINQKNVRSTNETSKLSQDIVIRRAGVSRCVSSGMRRQIRDSGFEQGYGGNIGDSDDGHCGSFEFGTGSIRGVHALRMRGLLGRREASGNR
jgi:hypothetical protein